MKKRIVCFVLTLIMLIGLVPVSAMSAAAASNAISATAIYVLKQLEGYQKTCNDGYIGYGTKCPDCLGVDSESGVRDENVNTCTNVMFEKEADKILREELKELDKAVNKFADKNGLSLSQNQHDALVMFTYQNGTAWTMGTGAFQSAIKAGYTGSRFLDAICRWNTTANDDYRRRVEANIYLNGVYSSSAPSRYIRVEMIPYNVDDGVAAEDVYMKEDNSLHYQYFDVASPVTITLTPAHDDESYRFLGWYLKDENGNYQRVTTLTSSYHNKVLVARYQDESGKIDNSNLSIAYEIAKSALLSTTVYNAPEGSKVTTYIDNSVGGKEVTIKLGDKLYVCEDRIVNGTLWAHIFEIKTVDEVDFENDIGWVKVKGTGTNNNTSTGLAMDVTVTVTNTYVNMRKNASITSAKNGSFNMGDTLRIIDTKNGADGFLWGQVAASADDDSAIGWVALMYTDYDSVIAGANSSAPEASIASATISYAGYVNVRSEAGINNQIVGALSHGETVELYEVKYVNGIRWGRCATGWFCLTYARVSGLDSNTGTGEAGFTNYIFTATLDGWYKGCTINEFFYESPNGKSVDRYVEDKDGNEVPEELKTDKFYISHLRETAGETWAYTNYGWIAVSTNPSGLAADDALEGDDVMDKGITLDWAKYYAISDDVTVRRNPATSSKRVDLMIKGTEFNVRAVVMVGESIWGYAKKVGEMDPYSYVGWVNLSNQNVSRNANDDYKIEEGTSSGTTVKMARVVGTDSLRVRNTGATYGTVIGALSNGTTAVVLDEKDGWYLLDIDVDNNPSTGSWCSGAYLEIYDDVQGGSTANSGTATGNVETGLGMVANTYTGVNVRSGAGTAYPAVNKLLTGTTVEILEVKTVGAAKWGRTAQGWVCMDYIVMVDKYQTGLNGGTGSGSSSTSTSNVAIYTGYVEGDVTIYKNTNTKVADGDVTKSVPVADHVRELSDGDRITLHEIIVQVEYDEVKAPETDEGVVSYKRTTYWARVNEGYIFAPASCIKLDTLDEHTYTVKDTTNEAYVNENIDGIGDATFKLSKGQNVVVTMLEIRYSDVWGYVEFDEAEGWVPMSRMTKGFASSTEPEETEPENNNSGSNTTTGTGSNGTTDTTGTVIGSTGNTGGSVSASGYKYTGKVINTNQVNVRATASTTANVTTTLKSGAALVIYETVISESMAWGRCDSGWVYLYYVDLTPVGTGAVDAKVVYNDNTIIYKDMGMSEATGSTYAKMAVVDIYEIVGKMARTELGWIHMDNLL